MKTVCIIATDPKGRRAMLRLETEADWIPLEMKDIGNEPFTPVELSDVELQNGDNTKTSILRYAVPVTFRCYT